jgi:hypothetical protein
LNQLGTILDVLNIAADYVVVVVAVLLVLPQ